MQNQNPNKTQEANPKPVSPTESNLSHIPLEERHFPFQVVIIIALCVAAIAAGITWAVMSGKFSSVSDSNVATEESEVDTTAEFGNQADLQERNIEVIWNEKEIFIDGEITLHIDDVPDSVEVEPGIGFGSSDKFNSVLASPNGKWLALGVSGAAHDFGWFYNVESGELTHSQFQYGGGVEAKRWISNTEVEFEITTPKPETRLVTAKVPGVNYTLDEWKTYKNEKFGFSIQYPDEYNANEFDSQVGSFDQGITIRSFVPPYREIYVPQKDQLQITISASDKVTMTRESSEVPGELSSYIANAEDVTLDEWLSTLHKIFTVSDSGTVEVSGISATDIGKAEPINKEKLTRIGTMRSIRFIEDGVAVYINIEPHNSDLMDVANDIISTFEFIN